MNYLNKLPGTIQIEQSDYNLMVLKNNKTFILKYDNDLGYLRSKSNKNEAYFEGLSIQALSKRAYSWLIKNGYSENLFNL